MQIVWFVTIKKKNQNPSTIFLLIIDFLKYLHFKKMLSTILKTIEFLIINFYFKT